VPLALRRVVFVDERRSGRHPMGDRRRRCRHLLHIVHHSALRCPSRYASALTSRSSSSPSTCNAALGRCRDVPSAVRLRHRPGRVLKDRAPRLPLRRTIPFPLRIFSANVRRYVSRSARMCPQHTTDTNEYEYPSSEAVLQGHAADQRHTVHRGADEGARRKNRPGLHRRLPRALHGECRRHGMLRRARA
jgi:hypothetical protein